MKKKAVEYDVHTSCYLEKDVHDKLRIVTSILGVTNTEYFNTTLKRNVEKELEESVPGVVEIEFKNNKIKAIELKDNDTLLEVLEDNLELFKSPEKKIKSLKKKIEKYTELLNNKEEIKKLTITEKDPKNNSRRKLKKPEEIAEAVECMKQREIEDLLEIESSIEDREKKIKEKNIIKKKRTEYTIKTHIHIDKELHKIIKALAKFYKLNLSQYFNYLVKKTVENYLKKEKERSKINKKKYENKDVL